MVFNKNRLSLILVFMFIISCLLSGCSLGAPDESDIKKYASQHFKGKYSMELIQDTDFVLEYKVTLDKLSDLPFKIACSKKTYAGDIPVGTHIYDNFEDVFKTYYIEKNPLDNDEIFIDTNYNYYTLMDDKNIVEIVKYLCEYDSKYVEALKTYEKKVSKYPYGCFIVINHTTNEHIQDYLGLSDEKILKLYEKNKFRFLIYNTESYGTGRRFNPQLSSNKEIVYVDDETVQFINDYAASHPNEVPDIER